LTSYYSIEENRKLVDLIANASTPLASFHLKVTSHSLLGQPRKQKESMQIADLFVSTLQDKIEKYKTTHQAEQAKSGFQSMTSIPFFDIDFETVLRFATKAADKINVKFIDDHLELIKDIFGLRNLQGSIVHLKNQSIIPLGYLL
jgi:hypothetical protein